jgi:hypothetical protein
MNANQIFNWLKDARFAPSPDEADTAVFLPIEVSVSRHLFPLFWNRTRLAVLMVV